MKYKELNTILQEQREVIQSINGFLMNGCIDEYSEKLADFYEIINTKVGRESYRQDPEGFLERNVDEEILEAFQPLSEIFMRARSEFSETFGDARPRLMVGEREYVF